MPGGDKTGPAGQGTMTGRRAGFCMGNDTAGFQGSHNRSFWDRSFRCGGGRGWRNRTYASGKPVGMRFGATPAVFGSQDEKLWLKNQADALQKELRSLEQRLDKINSEKSTG